MEKPKIDYRHKWLVLAAVGMGTFLGTIDGSIVNIALPTITSDFGTTFATIQWVVLSYLLTITTLMLSIGRLADMIGKKPIYTVGFIIFTLGSLLCGLAPTVTLLILARVLQGVGASMVMDSLSSPTEVADAIIMEFCGRHGGLERGMPIVQHQFKRAGVDFNKPTKEQLEKACEYLVEITRKFQGDLVATQERTTLQKILEKLGA